jgi:hypothetical protein
MLSNMRSNGKKKNAYGVSMSQRKRVNIGMTSVVCVQQGNCITWIGPRHKNGQVPATQSAGPLPSIYIRAAEDHNALKHCWDGCDAGKCMEHGKVKDMK